MKNEVVALVTESVVRSISSKFMIHFMQESALPYIQWLLIKNARVILYLPAAEV